MNGIRVNHADVDRVWNTVSYRIWLPTPPPADFMGPPEFSTAIAITLHDEAPLGEISTEELAAVSTVALCTVAPGPYYDLTQCYPAPENDRLFARFATSHAEQLRAVINNYDIGEKLSAFLTHVRSETTQENLQAAKITIDTFDSTDENYEKCPGIELCALMQVSAENFLHLCFNHDASSLLEAFNLGMKVTFQETSCAEPIEHVLQRAVQTVQEDVPAQRRRSKPTQ